MIILFINSVSYSQTYSPLNLGFDQASNVRSIYYDSSLNKLFVGGLFSYTATGFPVFGVAQWDGQNWDSLSSGLDGVCFAIQRYGNEIILGGSFNHAGGVLSKGLVKWNGSNFSAFADLEDLSDGCVLSLHVDNSDLYAGGCFNSVNGLPASGFAKFDGTNWITYPVLNVTYPYVIPPDRSHAWAV